MRDAEIIVDFIYPPIPDRNFDWQATWDGDEPNDNGQMLHGFGRTPLDAIRELLDSTESYDEIKAEYAQSVQEAKACAKEQRKASRP